MNLEQTANPELLLKSGSYNDALPRLSAANPVEANLSNANLNSIDDQSRKRVSI